MFERDGIKVFTFPDYVAVEECLKYRCINSLVCVPFSEDFLKRVHHCEVNSPSQKQVRHVRVAEHFVDSRLEFSLEFDLFHRVLGALDSGKTPL